MPAVVGVAVPCSVRRVVGGIQQPDVCLSPGQCDFDNCAGRLVAQIPEIEIQFGASSSMSVWT
jgi:hypothetical protein